MIFAHPDVEPHELAFDEETGARTLSELMFTQPATPRWGTADDHYPAVVELYEGGSGSAAPRARWNCILASRAGYILDFTVADTTVPR